MCDSHSLVNRLDKRTTPDERHLIIEKKTIIPLSLRMVWDTGQLAAAPSRKLDGSIFTGQRFLY